MFMLVLQQRQHLQVILMPLHGRLHLLPPGELGHGQGLLLVVVVGGLQQLLHLRRRVCVVRCFGRKPCGVR